MDIPWDGMNSRTDVDVSGRGAGRHPMGWDGQFAILLDITRDIDDLWLIADKV